MAFELQYDRGDGKTLKQSISTKPTLIGSLSSNHVAMPMAGVEPIHAIVELGDDGLLRVTDLGTLAGVMVNGRRVAVETVLKEGDRVKIGTALFRVIGQADPRPIIVGPDAEMSPAQAVAVDRQKAKTITPPKLTRLFSPKRQTRNGPTLEVVAYWGHTVLNVDHFQEGRKGFDSVLIGDPDKAHFLSGGRNQRDSQILAELDGPSSCVVRLHQGMQARVRRDGQTGKHRDVGDVRLGLNDYAHVRYGPIHYFLHYATEPHVNLPPPPPKDKIFWGLTILAAVTYVALIICSLLYTPPPVEVGMSEADKREISIPVFTAPQEQEVTVVVTPEPPPVRQPQTPPPERPQRVAEENRVAPPVPRERPQPPQNSVARRDQPITPSPSAANVTNNTRRPPQATPTPARQTSNPRAVGAPGGSQQRQPPRIAISKPRINGPQGVMTNQQPQRRSGQRGSENDPRVGVEDGTTNRNSAPNLRGLSDLGVGSVLNRAGDRPVNFRDSPSANGRPGGLSNHTRGLDGRGTGPALDIARGNPLEGRFGDGDGLVGPGGLGPGAGPGGRNGPGGTGTDLGIQGPRQHGAPVILGPMQAPGMPATVSHLQIQRVIKANLNQIRHCYERTLQYNPNVAGKITTNFAVGNGGRVSSVNTSSPSITDQQLHGCIQKRVRTWNFPMLKGMGTVNIKYPFVLTPTIL